MTTDLLLASAPVIEVDGEVAGEMTRDLIRLDVQHDTKGLKTLAASFLGSSPEAAPGETDYLDGRLDFGMPLVCSIGPDGTHRFIFRGTVSAIEARYLEGQTPVVTVRAEDALMKLRMTRRSRTYTDVSDGDIADVIAREHGLTPDVDAPGPTYDLLQQFNQTDLAFLRDRAHRINAELWVDDTTLGFATRDRRSGIELTLVRGNHLIDVEAIADLAHIRSEVQVSGFSADSRTTIDERSDGSVLSSEVGGGTSGVELLEQALGSRPTARVRDVAITTEDAAAWSKASMERRGRSFLRVNGTTSGTADMIVGSRLTLERMGEPFDGGGYYVSAVHHSYDRINGFRTRFAAERPTVGGGA